MAKWNPEDILNKIKEKNNKSLKEKSFEDWAFQILKIIGIGIVGLLILFIAVAIILLLLNLFLKLISGGDWGSDWIIETVGQGIAYVIGVPILILIFIAIAQNK